MGPFFSLYFLSILTAIALYIALTFSIEEGLVSVFLIGFVVDISSFNIFPFATLLLLAELLIIYLAKRKVVDFRNPASIFLFLAGFALLRFVIESFFYQGFTNEISVTYSILANILLSFVLAFVIFKFSVVRKNDEAE